MFFTFEIKFAMGESLILVSFYLYSGKQNQLPRYTESMYSMNLAQDGLNAIV